MAAFSCVDDHPSSLTSHACKELSSILAFFSLSSSFMDGNPALLVSKSQGRCLQNTSTPQTRWLKTIHTSSSVHRSAIWAMLTDNSSLLFHSRSTGAAAHRIWNISVLTRPQVWLSCLMLGWVFCLEQHDGGSKMSICQGRPRWEKSDYCDLASEDR